MNISYISKLEKLRGDTNTITALLNSNGVLKEGNENVLKIAQDFYTNLYRNEPECIIEQNHFLRNIEKHPTMEEKEELDLALSENEIFSALNDLKKNKSPGDDSLTCEFYLYFWNDLKNLYIKCIKEIFENNDLSSSQNRGLITIIYKKN